MYNSYVKKIQYGRCLLSALSLKGFIDAHIWFPFVTGGAEDFVIFVTWNYAAGITYYFFQGGDGNEDRTYRS